MIRRNFAFCLLVASSLQGAASAQPNLTREQALEGMDGMVSLVRGSLNGDPEYVKKVLIWDMARPAGDDPRVAATCAYFIDNSTNTLNVITAIQALGVVYGKLPKGKRSEIGAIIRRAFKHDDLRVQAATAGELFMLGDKAEAKRQRQDILRRYRKKVPDEELVEEVGYQEGVPESLQIISDVIDKSTNSAAIAQAIQSLGGAGATADSKETAQRVDLFRRVITRKDLKFLIRSRTADSLAAAGPEYREESYRSDLELLKSPGDLSDSTSMWAYAALVRKVLRMNRPDSAGTIHQAVVDHRDDLLNFYERGMAHLNKDSSDYRDANREVEKIKAISNDPAR